MMHEKNKKTNNSNSKLFLKTTGEKDDEPWYLNNPARNIGRGPKRVIDSMSYSEIYEMYDDEDYRCDTCGKSLREEGKINISTKDHIIHLLNPMILWSCMQCINDDFKHDRVVMMTSK